MSEFSGFDEEVTLEEETEKVVALEEAKKKRPPFAYWNVGGNEYKLKLKAEKICKLEEQFKGSLYNVVSSGDIPPLRVMLTIIQAAATDWNHTMRYKDAQKIYDTYCSEGGSQMSLFTDVVMEIFSVSGFFTKNQAEEVSESLEEMRGEM